MPLFIEDKQVGPIDSIEDLYCKYPSLKESAKAFLSKPVVSVDPKSLLYVQQREVAATTKGDKHVSVIGTEDATTCHMVVLRHTGTGAVALAHCDGFNTPRQVSLIVKAVTSLSGRFHEGRLELHVVGGFEDDKKLSEKISHDLLTMFQNQDLNIYLETCCTTEMNDVLVDGIHKPIIYGIGVKVETGEVFPASFTFKGPAENLRSARRFTKGEMVEIYEPNQGIVKVGPCSWPPQPDLIKWMTMTDKEILEALSTSPKAEPSDFVRSIKATMWFILDHPNPDSLFPGDQPQRYRKTDCGDWDRIVQP
ncbi:protein N-terminal asparagine amidohydrolase-like [Salarias fasciatus]|uniref:protein N-terminal asparagine amidohydrolase-like n=1 Tax=Salarias fasciatus TaxID=181472 RepID=UPI00117700CC|nr:protein N-terminal asparagine amidohydrolase-like [Salarias fasciatus]